MLHTVAWTLYALGNSVDSVAGFVGHRSSAVTNDVYIAMTRSQRQQMMDVPWLRGVTTDTVRRQGEECARAICSPFGSVDGRTFPDLTFDTPVMTSKPRDDGLYEKVRRYLADNASI